MSYHQTVAKAVFDEAIATTFNLNNIDQSIIDGLVNNIANVLKVHGVSNGASAPTVNQIQPKVSGKKSAGKKKRAKRLPTNTGYHMFVRLESNKLSNCENHERMTKLGQKWKSMTDDEKQYYKDLAKRFNEEVRKRVSDPNEEYDRETVVTESLDAIGITLPAKKSKANSNAKTDSTNNEPKVIEASA